eukprot:CAMPEP_0170159144 /NCGR_PEP_ID=MMETSP0033_2-20121228/70029_1 /TAXON_ID=195969 /ORGANISM="Dolichomastix tenuilepis, Strain CCMP3274" /LENGTH=114 /DNA_ID=CAMNT_0010396613 /DNA_START=224 /DNA_END=565 /DNA_ORIENTATION=+
MTAGCANDDGPPIPNELNPALIAPLILRLQTRRQRNGKLAQLRLTQLQLQLRSASHFVQQKRPSLRQNCEACGRPVSPQRPSVVPVSLERLLVPASLPELDAILSRAPQLHTPR